MGEVKLEDIFEILDNYDKDNITIATLGSHTSLHILQGAKEEGFRTAIVCEKGREVPYQRFDVADEYIIVDKFKDIVNEAKRHECYCYTSRFICSICRS